MEKICERHNIPHSIKIFGNDIAINIVSGLRNIDGECAWGQTYLNEDPISIALDADMQAYKTYRVFIHEVIEAINSELELGLEHDNISRLELGLTDFLLNNDIDWGYVNGISSD